MPKYFSVKHRRSKNKHNKSLRNHNVYKSNFQQEITVRFLEILTMVKLFHWKTHSYATHKATDELYEKLNTNIDSFIEILLGKIGGTRTNLMNQKTIRLIDLTNQDSFKREIEHFKTYLVELTNHPTLKEMTNTDLLNIRDTILGDMNQLLYLLSFH
jgi:DNA-binding ferritin-like protein